MKTRIHNKSAFTLIELLMVIAIIGILAGILIPTVGSVKKQANIATSKSQLTNYVTAITMFKGEYGYYPFTNAQRDNGRNINEITDFIMTLSGRDPDSNETKAAGGNRRAIGFHSFSESEFFVDDNDEIDDTQIADRFNNVNLFIVIDPDGDGQITVPAPSGGSKTLRASVTAYAESGDNGEPAYYLYD